MVIVRWLSLVLIVLAVMLLGADLVGTLEKKAVVIRPLQDILVLFNYDMKQSLVLNFPPWVVNIVVTIIEAPGWLTLAFVACSCAIIASSPKPFRPLPTPPPISR